MDQEFIKQQIALLLLPLSKEDLAKTIVAGLEDTLKSENLAQYLSNIGTIRVVLDELEKRGVQ